MGSKREENMWDPGTGRSRQVGTLSGRVRRERPYYYYYPSSSELEEEEEEEEEMDFAGRRRSHRLPETDYFDFAYHLRSTDRTVLPTGMEVLP